MRESVYYRPKYDQIMTVVEHGHLYVEAFTIRNENAPVHGYTPVTELFFKWLRSRSEDDPLVYLGEL